MASQREGGELSGDFKSVREPSGASGTLGGRPPLNPRGSARSRRSLNRIRVGLGKLRGGSARAMRLGKRIHQKHRLVLSKKSSIASAQRVIKKIIARNPKRSVAKRALDLLKKRVAAAAIGIALTAAHKIFAKAEALARRAAAERCGDGGAHDRLFVAPIVALNESSKPKNYFRGGGGTGSGAEPAISSRSRSLLRA